MWTRNIILILFCYPNQTESAAHAKLKITSYNRLPDGLTYCEKDTDCDENEFCRFYADLSYCHNCIDCYGYYKREVPEGGCAKNRSLCSDCIPGYRDILEECVKVGSSTPLILSTSTGSPGDLTNPDTLKIILPCVGTFLFICCSACLGLFCFWKKKKKRGKLENRPTYENKDENDHVPVMVKENELLLVSPHNTDPSAPLLIDPEPQTDSFLNDHLLNDQREIEHESLSQAMVFNPPIYENPQPRNFTQNDDLPQPRNPPRAVDNNGRRIQVWNQPNYSEDRAIRPPPAADLAPQEPLHEGGPLYPDPVMRGVGMSVNRDPNSRMNPEAEPRVDSILDPMPNPRLDPRPDSMPNQIPNPRADPRLDPMQNLRLDPMQNTRRNPLQNPRLDPMHNPRLDPIQNPRLDPMENPRLDPMQNLRLDPIENPRLDPLQNPRLNSIQNLRLDPMENPRLDPLQNPRADPMQNPGADPMPDPETEHRPSGRSQGERGILYYNCRLEFQL